MAKNTTKTLEGTVREQEIALYRSAAHQISVSAKEYGYIEIHLFPSLDSALAASAAMDFILASGGRAKTVVSIQPPEKTDTPLLLLGYPSTVVEETRFKAPSVLITDTEKPQGLTPIPVVYKKDTSITALTVNVLHEIGVVGDRALLALIAGYWRGYDIGGKAEFVGSERGVIETLKMEGKVVEELTLRVFRWYSEPLSEAIYITMDPFLPGLTGNREGVSSLFEDPRLKQLAELPAPKAPQEKLVLLAETLYKLLRDRSRVARRPSEIIGLAYHTESFPIPDPREAAIVLASTAGLEGLAKILPLASSPEGVLSAASHYYYSSFFPKAVEVIEDSAEKAKGITTRKTLGLKTVILEGAGQELIPVVERELRKLGVIPPDAALLVNNTVFVETVVSLNGYRWLYENLRKHCIDHEPGTVFLEVKPHCT